MQSSIIAFFIILDTGAVLHTHGVTNIQNATQAAEALRPLGGELTFLLFSLGIIGTGLLAVPVLAGSAAYALAETLKWPIGLERKPEKAKGFYATVGAATLLGVALNFTSINPIKALFWSAVVNGVAAVPIMIVMMLMTANPKVTGTLRLPWRQKASTDSLVSRLCPYMWRRPVLPARIGNWSLTSLQQRLVETGGRLVKHTRYYWLLLAEGI
jgi:Mn2+/Fe2+ NRAMP family transporter